MTRWFIWLHILVILHLFFLWISTSIHKCKLAPQESSSLGPLSVTARRRRCRCDGSERTGLCLQDLSWGRILLKELCQGVLSIHLNKKSPGSPVTQNIQIALKVLKSSFRQISVESSDEFRSASPNHARSGPYNGHDARDGSEGKSTSVRSPVSIWGSFRLHRLFSRVHKNQNLPSSRCASQCPPCPIASTKGAANHELVSQPLLCRSQNKRS